MARPQIKPPIFIAMQNGLAALLFALLLGAEMVRRLLYEYPESETLWWLTILANRTVMPMLKYTNLLLPTPEKLIVGLAMGVVLPLLAWWTRYWLVTAVAGHLTLAALVVITLPLFRKGNPALTLQGLGGYALLALTLFVLVMCIADHVAFMRYLASLWKHFRGTRR